MSTFIPLARTKRNAPHLLRILTQSRKFSATTVLGVTKDWEGRQPQDHVTNSDNELDIQSSASSSGKRQRAEESHPTSAATEKDTGSNNQQAKKDHPEAPGPVIGMNDERGGVRPSG
ncbi:MAG: hypothetical protein Q9195_001023 [Heterodermia aff. obscurata]